MAYFRENETEETKRQPIDLSAEETAADEEKEYIESEYDDGFDDPDTEEDVTEEERLRIRRNRFRLASGAGNITMVIVGTLVILILLGLIFNMISFVLNDADRNFTLFQTRL